jgi:hypothetical protein
MPIIEVEKIKEVDENSFPMKSIAIYEINPLSHHHHLSPEIEQEDICKFHKRNKFELCGRVSE